MSINPFLPPPSALSVLPKIPFWGINHDSRFFGYSIETRFSGSMSCFRHVMHPKHATHAFKNMHSHVKTCNACIENMHSHVENTQRVHPKTCIRMSKTCIRMPKTCHLGMQTCIACIQKHAFACQKHAILACKHASHAFKNMPLHVLNPGFSSQRLCVFFKSPFVSHLRTVVDPLLGPLVTPYEVPRFLSKPIS